MSLEDIPGGRLKAAREIASPEGPLGELWKRFDLRTLQFSERLRPAEDSIVVRGERTAIGAALEELEGELGEKPQAAILLTDGGNNSGPEPLTVVRGLEFPVYPVGLGSSQGRRDVSIERVELNEICYAGDSVPVEVVVRSEGFLGELSELSLREKGEVLKSSQVALTREASLRSLSFSFVPEKPGTHRYELLLSPQPGELSEENNERSLSIEVLKSKMKIVVVSSHPSWDLKFLSRSVASDPNLELASFTRIGEGKWLWQKGEEEGLDSFSGAQLGEWDILLLYDLSEAQIDQEFINSTVKTIESRGGGLVLWGDLPLGLLPISPVIPGRGVVEKEFLLEVTETGLSHAAMRLSEDPLANRRAWEETPPLSSCYRTLGAKPGSQVLGVHPTEKTAQGPMPILAVQNYGKGKVLHISALSLWRWALLPLSLDKEEVFSRFWSNVFRYLSVREEVSRLLVSPSKRVFPSGEEIEFLGQLYDKSYKPLDGAQLKAIVAIREGPPLEIPLLGKGGGRYEGSVAALPPGEYEFRSEARIGGELLRGGRGGILIEKHGLEFRSVGLNEQLLKEIAERSGGTYYPAHEAGEVARSLNLEERKVEERREIELSASPPLFLLIIFLLGSEWLIRRRRGFV